MRHAGTQEIETPRLLLRRLLPSDAPMMYANWASDPEVTRWLRWTPHKDVAETREDRKSTRLNSSHLNESRMPSSA